MLLVLVGKLKIFRLSVLKLIDLPNWGVGIEQYSVANRMQDAVFMRIVSSLFALECYSLDTELATVADVMERSFINNGRLQHRIFIQKDHFTISQGTK